MRRSLHFLIHEGGAGGADTYRQAGAVTSTTLYWEM